VPGDGGEKIESPCTGLRGQAAVCLLQGLYQGSDEGSAKWFGKVEAEGITLDKVQVNCPVTGDKIDKTIMPTMKASGCTSVVRLLGKVQR